jgi:predicted ATPase/DNA-binding CsgD family transcriptional regulator
MEGGIKQFPLDPLTEREMDILHRMAERLSDREIAQEFVLSLNTVKWHNRQIYSKLAVGSRSKAVAKAREHGLLKDRQDRSTPPAIAIPRHNLPVQITTFIGRKSEIAELTQLLNEAHLLSLTGPGGVGKTRLALKIAAGSLDDFKDGVYFVDLASIGPPELLAKTIAGAIGIMETPEHSMGDSLKEYLRHKRMLLLLDNFEHIIEAASFVGDLLSTAPGLRILVTSREALRIYGEREYPVQPMELPDLNGVDSLADFSHVEAVALFSQRAQAAKLDFEINDEDIPAIAEICRRLDGLPLAIELAAARVRLFSPGALLGQMQDRFTELQSDLRGQPARHRTLGSAIGWSYDLLDEAEKKLFARLSVFQGGRTIEAVEAICSDDLAIDILDGLESLLNKNLLRLDVGPEGEPRFVMLETIHEFARNQLETFGETEVLRSRHAEYFTRLVEHAEPHTRGGGDQMRWLHRLEADHENLRTAYAWSNTGGDVELAYRLVGALGYFWWRQGWYAEGKQWTTRAMDESADATASIRASVLNARSIVHHYLNELDQAKRTYRKALALYREMKSQRNIGWTLAHLSYQSLGRRDEYEQAVSLAEDGLTLLLEINDQPGVAFAFNILGELARVQGDFARAKDAYIKCLEIAREIGDRMRESFQLINLAFIAQNDGDPEGAQVLVQQSLTIGLEIGHIVLTADKFSALAGTAVALNDPKRAACLYGAADRLYERRGYIPQAADLPEFERDKSTVREQLGEETFEEQWSLGWAMALEEAIAFALGDDKHNQEVD